MSPNGAPLFPTIRDVAEEADKLPDSEDQPKKVGEDVEDEEERPVTEVESLCMQCYQNGTTSFLLTSIPFFREVIVMSFRCEYCGFKNNEIQSAGAIKPEGAIYTVKATTRDDLNRTIVKSDTCTVSIPEIELTIPSSRGQLTNIEGLLRDVVRDLSLDQPLRRIEDEGAYARVQQVIDACKAFLGDPEDSDEEETGDDERPIKPFTISVDDPASNSFIEFSGNMADPKWSMRTYHRTFEQNVALGLVDKDTAPPEQAAVVPGPPKADSGEKLEGNEELFVFTGSCGSCGHPNNTVIKKLTIPYFKDVLIMATTCEHCGYRDSEVKSGSAISPFGKRITLRVEDRDDLSRDILKSESCGLTIPEIDLVLQSGTLGGRFTTLEGILEQIYDELSQKVFVDATSDGGAFDKFLQKLHELKNADEPFTLILDDPLANSYLQNIYAPDPDPNMTIEMYERTWEQNEDWGLNDMKVEGYEGDPMLEPAEGGGSDAAASS